METRKVWKTFNGEKTYDLIMNINNEMPNGGTNIYQCVYDAFKILEGVSNDYNKTVILMTDGASTTSSYSNLALYYDNNNLDIPVYSIMFGSATREQLDKLANLTNAKVFDGKTNLKSAFKEVRSYN
ncbi:MAG: VWA domain-containing protein [Clostridium sp.]|nr:MAG: VWA domain-containing protein [Clostridium sp.]